MIKEDLCLGETPVEGSDARFGEEQLWLVFLHLSRQQTQQSRQAGELLPVIEIMSVLAHEIGREDGIAGSQGMVQGFLDPSVRGEPGACPPMQGGDLLRCGAFAQLLGQEPLEQMVEAIKLTLRIKGNDEEVF